jgi:serine phosphatase RsbU (regulator of sigma subunit)
MSIFTYDMVKTQYNTNVSLREQEKNIETKRNLVVEQNKKTLFQKNEMISSIESAKRIQTAMLPSKDKLDTYLEKYFIYYKPKDIVSGDFYWVTKTKSKVLFAVGDCTGHGVPAAFTSLLGISYLNNIAIENNVTTPNVILQNLRDKIKFYINLDDSIDLCLIAIDKDTLELEFSGAFNSCLIVRNNELIELKADRMPVGKLLAINKSFTNRLFKLQKNDFVYCFTDGLIDQFGGVNDKKLKYKSFKNLILEMSKKPIEEQQRFLEDFFNYWAKGYEQLDDITVTCINI